MAVQAPKAPRPADQQDVTPPAPAGARPAFTIRRGNVSAAVFLADGDSPNKEPRTLYRLSVRRSYRHQASGEWRHTHTFFPDDISAVIAALEECEQFIDQAVEAAAQA